MAETRGKTIPFADKTRFYRSELKSLRLPIFKFSTTVIPGVWKVLQERFVAQKVKQNDNCKKLIFTFLVPKATSILILFTITLLGQTCR